MDTSSSNIDSIWTFSYSLNSERIMNSTDQQLMDLLKKLKLNHDNLELGNFYTNLILNRFSNLGYSANDIKNIFKLNYESSQPPSLDNNLIDQELILSPLNWSFNEILIWLKKEGLDCQEIINSFRINKVDGEVLMDLTAEDVREELKITSIKLRKRLFEAIQRLKVECVNTNFAQIGKLMKEDIIENDFKEESYPIIEQQLVILEELNKEIEDFEFSAIMNKKFHQIFDIEETDHQIAVQLDLRLNG